MADVTEKDTTGERVDVVDAQSQSKPPRGHCKKWWWAWLIGFCLLVLVIMIIIAYAIVPAVGQKDINKTYLELHSLTIVNPSPESFTLSINSTISGVSGVAKHAYLDPMVVLFFIENHDPIQPFMSLPLPRIGGGDNIPVVAINHTTQIENELSFGEFATTLLASAVLRVAIRGRTELHLAAFKAGVDYNEVITMNGFNGLSGMEITNYSLLTTAQSGSDNANLAGKVLIPNPSVVTIEMGDVHINFALNGTQLGNGTIPSLLIQPGNHTYDFRATLAPTSLIRLASAITSGDPVELQVKGNGTTFDGVDIPWLSAPLSALAVTVPVEV
ncbi:hypothetical protein RUND412_001476 [Rhizina undulata]